MYLFLWSKVVVFVYFTLIWNNSFMYLFHWSKVLVFVFFSFLTSKLIDDVFSAFST